MKAPLDEIGGAERALQRLRIFGLAAIGFVLMLSYALARPASESLFLEVHGAEALPWVWLLVAGASAVVVWLYNQAVTRVGLLRLFGAVSVLSGLVFALLMGARQLRAPGAHYALYVWKDIYIVALVEIFYSYGNSVFPIRVARWTYGLFGFVGALGGLVGNLGVGVIATHYGSPLALWILAPLLLALGLGSFVFGRYAGIGAPLSKQSTGTVREAWDVIRGSAYLWYVLALIALVQVVVTLIDFDFNALVQLAYPLRDARTELIGQVYAAMSASTLVLHAITGVTLRLAGVPITLLAIPLLLGSTVGAYIVAPVLAVAAVMKVASKALDYTLFRAAKEILYIPLTYRERTQGKALVDMLTYRVAKGGASLAVLGLVRGGLTQLVRWLTLVLIAAWLLLTTAIARRFRQQVSREQELSREN